MTNKPDVSLEVAKNLWEMIKILGLSNDRLALKAINEALLANAADQFTDVKMDLVRRYAASKTNAEIRLMFEETAQPVVSNMTTLQAAFAAGFNRAAEWADRNDLHADVGSPAYLRDMAADLLEFADAAIGAPQPVAAHPTLETLASLLAALYFGQYNTNEDERLLDRNIDKALKDYNIATGQFESGSPQPVAVQEVIPNHPDVDLSGFLAQAANSVAIQEALDWKKIESFVDEFVDGYQMIGESEDGRDGCYTPNVNDHALLRDCIAGLLAEDEFLALLSIAKATPKVEPLPSSYQAGTVTSQPDGSGKVTFYFADVASAEAWHDVVIHNSTKEKANGMPVADALDAARYRWLREQDDRSACFVVYGRNGQWGECGHCEIYDDLLDETIDAARDAQQKGNS